jgi:hypothetical protein
MMKKNTPHFFSRFRSWPILLKNSVFHADEKFQALQEHLLFSNTRGY